MEKTSDSLVPGVVHQPVETVKVWPSTTVRGRTQDGRTKTKGKKEAAK